MCAASSALVFFSWFFLIFSLSMLCPRELPPRLPHSPFFCPCLICQHLFSSLSSISCPILFSSSLFLPFHAFFPLLSLFLSISLIFLPGYLFLAPSVSTSGHHQTPPFAVYLLVKKNKNVFAEHVDDAATSVGRRLHHQEHHSWIRRSSPLVALLSVCVLLLVHSELLLLLIWSRLPFCLSVCCNNLCPSPARSGVFSLLRSL